MGWHRHSFHNDGKGYNWWHRPWDKAAQAEFLRGVWTIAFSKPLVQEAAWSYAVSDYDTHVMCGGLFAAVGKPKPSYYAMKNLITSWTSSGTGKTDENGRFTFRGFAGNYDMKVTTGNTSNPLQRLDDLLTPLIGTRFLFLISSTLLILASAPTQYC